jgi:hypothetical protein
LPDQVNEQISRLERAVGRLEGIAENYEAEQIANAARHLALSDRMTKMEKWQNRLIGGGSIVGVLIGWIANLFAKKTGFS